MSQAIIGKWGKNLAVRFSADVVRAAGLGDGERVEVLVQQGAVIIRKAVPSPTIDDLFRDKSPEAWRAFYADAYDWGPDRGREFVEE